MVKKATVPDAWDDDWESQADQTSHDAPTRSEPEPPAPQTRTERLAQHAESNRRIWESADTTERNIYVEATNSVPLTSTFKPQVKVLSRKPVIAKRDPVTGLSQLTLEDDEDSPKTEPQLSPEELRAKQKRDREEKQRRYEEARAKIFGESAPSSGASSPGAVTPPRPDGQHTPRGRGRGRGRGGAGRVDTNNISDSRQREGRRVVPPASSVRELYDPNYATRPDSGFQGRGGGESPARLSTPRNEQPAIRAPRGPDGSGRGGIGFTGRVTKET